MKRIWSILFFCWCLIVLVLCIMPSSSFSNYPKFEHIDKIAHFSFFLLISFLFRSWKYRQTNISAVLYTTIIALIYGGSIELLQSYFFKREGDLWDLIADVLGGICGAIIFIPLKKYIIKLYNHA